MAKFSVSHDNVPLYLSGSFRVRNVYNQTAANGLSAQSVYVPHLGRSLTALSTNETMTAHDDGRQESVACA